MGSYRIISSDDHVFEPPDLWTSSIESRFRDRAPRVVRLEDGDWWSCDGKTVAATGFGFGGAQAGRRFEEPGMLTHADVFENVRPGGYLPQERVKDMDIDGVDVSVLYPTLGLQLFKVRDGELLTAMCRAYNNWLADFCGTFPRRLAGIAMLNLDDVGLAAKELERCRIKGLVGAIVAVYPPEGKRYDSSEYEPLWAAAQEAQMPLSLHLGTNRFGSGEGDGTGLGEERMSILVNSDHYVRMSLTDMIFSGVFERYPKLRVGAIEFELSWVPHFLDRLDYTYTQRAPGIAGYRFKEDRLPSDYFHRNMFMSFQEDGLGIRDWHIIGTDNLLWGSDYPHIESTFPRSREILGEILADCTEEEKARIAGGNAARVYNLD